MRNLSSQLLVCFVLFNQALFSQVNYQHWQRSSADLPFDESLEPFYHGVASGDPQQTSVVLWTKVSPELDGVIDVEWEISTDTSFASIVASGMTSTDSTVDYTVHIEPTGLTESTTYYYRFKAEGNYSLIGRTRTAASSADQLRFAVVSCNSYQGGYFNAFGRIAEKQDLDAVIHLGDFIYEYGNDTSGWAAAEERDILPDNEILSLSDYRLRYSWYRLDADLRRAMQQHPFIFVWDDHESANDSWTGGAENHDDATEGDWNTRVQRAKQAYFEWVPIRENSDSSIYRSIDYGSLAEIIMLDTRLEGREEQLVDADDPQVWDPDRTLLGTAQFDWFTNELKSATAQWKVVGNQVVFAPLLLDDFEVVYPGARSEFLDVWNGYPAEREKILDTLAAYSIDDAVFVTGDVHISVALDVPKWDGDSLFYDETDADGSLAVEFITTSISSNNFDETLGLYLANLVEGLFIDINPHGAYNEFDRHGYYILDLTPAKAQADFYYIDTKLSPSREESFDKGFYSLSGNNYLQEATGPADPKAIQPALAPDPTLTTSVSELNSAQLWNVYPNPAQNQLYTAFSISGFQQVRISLVDMQGKAQEIFHEQLSTGHYQMGHQIPTHLSAGNYVVVMEVAGQQYTKSLQLR